MTDNHLESAKGNAKNEKDNICHALGRIEDHLSTALEEPENANYHTKEALQLLKVIYERTSDEC